MRHLKSVLLYVFLYGVPVLCMGYHFTDGSIDDQKQFPDQEYFGSYPLLILGSFVVFIIIILVIRSQKLNKRNHQLLLEKSAEIRKQKEEISKIQLEFEERLSGIIHESRNIITLIKGPLEFLDKSEFTNEEEKRLVGIAFRNVLRLESLTSELTTQPEKIIATPTNNESALSSEKVQNKEKGVTIGSNPSLKPNLIYLADDNADMRDYLTGFLKEQYQIKQFEDGKELLKELDLKIPHLIIADLVMPRMSGIGLAKKLKGNTEWSNIPFIALSAVSDQSLKMEALKTGVDAFITKPFDPEELLLRIENLIVNQDNRESNIQEEDIPSESFEEKLLNKLEQEVKKHIKDPDFNVIRLANAGSLSERQLYRYLKQSTGLTPANFVKEIRLQKAFELARRNVYGTTAELAYSVGFQNPNYFVSVFKKRFGKKPSDLSREQ